MARRRRRPRVDTPTVHRSPVRPYSPDVLETRHLAPRRPDKKPRTSRTRPTAIVRMKRLQPLKTPRLRSAPARKRRVLKQAVLAQRIRCIEVARQIGRNRFQKMKLRLRGGLGSYLKHRRHTEQERILNRESKCTQ